MLTQLLVIIYLCFISLGLPDSLLGSAWPAMHGTLGVPVSLAGVLSMIISCSTVFSSLMSSRLVRRFGTGTLMVVSVGLTAAALLGFSFSFSFAALCVLAVPLGLGAGCVDTALNNFVALHYRAVHMNLLHCFWGIGATAGPFIMSLWLARNGNWAMGYRSISILQAVLVLVLLSSLPLWKRAAPAGDSVEKCAEAPAPAFSSLIRRSDFRTALFAFFSYCAVETTAGLWAGSYTTLRYGVPSETAAVWTSFFYFGITLGRFICGFAALRIGSRQLIRAGQSGILCGILLLLLPLPLWKLPVGLWLIGIGCAPIFPGMLHQTPRIFGKEISQSIMGFQMAAAYIGSMFLPALFGLIADHAGVSLLPPYLLLFLVLLAVCTERIGRKDTSCPAGAE
jgi:fucose permease